MWKQHHKLEKYVAKMLHLYVLWFKCFFGLTVQILYSFAAEFDNRCETGKIKKELVLLLLVNESLV